jgi:hypothetical protein
MPKKPKSKKINLERIVWNDHCSYSNPSWKDGQDLVDLTPTEIDSVGWVIAEDKDRLVMAAHMSGSGMATGEMCIIKKCIKSRKKLK